MGDYTTVRSIYCAMLILLAIANKINYYAMKKTVTFFFFGLSKSYLDVRAKL